VALTLHYSFIDATYRTAFVENSPSNSSADANGAIAVHIGDRMPSVPRHSFKLRAEISPTLGWSLAANSLIAGSIYARGDENNLDRYGRVPGFGSLNLDSQYQVTRGLQVFARVNNVFNRRYANFGTLGDNLFTGPAQSFNATNPRAEQFRGYAAPRGAWIGLQYSTQ
jgi:outer membrane receptor protein involved in Fe transport